LAKRRSGNIICGRGESTFPFNIADVFKVIMDPESVKEINPQVDTVDTLETFSSHTWVNYLKFKQVMHGGSVCILERICLILIVYILSRSLLECFFSSESII
jgi:hypothetical protein